MISGISLSLLQARFTRIEPHIVDTVLLLAAFIASVARMHHPLGLLAMLT